MNPIELRIRQLRQARGWSQADLAKRAGVRQATVSRIENNRVKSLDLAVFEKIAEALEVDPGYLVVKVPPSDLPGRTHDPEDRVNEQP